MFFSEEMVCTGRPSSRHGRSAGPKSTSYCKGPVYFQALDYGQLRAICILTEITLRRHPRIPRSPSFDPWQKILCSESISWPEVTAQEDGNLYGYQRGRGVWVGKG